MHAILGFYVTIHKQHGVMKICKLSIYRMVMKRYFAMFKRKKDLHFSLSLYGYIATLVIVCTRNNVSHFIFESVFFDVPRAIYRLLLLNK